ncbi:MAG: OsmC family protein [Saprospiraceae bacterium]|nr:OsmC family protein [Saprospiraceae bacterium]
MNTATIEYLGSFHTRCTHDRSGQSFETDAPVDNRGKGEFFSPTDLFATSLASCILTIIGLRAADGGFSIEGTKVEVKKTMDSNPRRIAQVEMTFHMPKDQKYTATQKKVIEKVAHTCPVSYSLHPDTKEVAKFIWGDD